MQTASVKIKTVEFNVSKASAELLDKIDKLLQWNKKSE